MVRSYEAVRFPCARTNARTDGPVRHFRIEQFSGQFERTAGRSRSGENTESLLAAVELDAVGAPLGALGGLKFRSEIPRLPVRRARKNWL